MSDIRIFQLTGASPITSTMQLAEEDSAAANVTKKITVAQLLSFINNQLPTNVTTATYTTLVTDTFLSVNRAGAVAITLMTSPAIGQTLIIKDSSGAAATNNITIIGNIDGAANLIMNVNYQAAAFKYNGTEWGIF